MSYLAIISYLLFLPGFTVADTPDVNVYCFSEELEAGFKDEKAGYWCKELGKRGEKKNSLAIVKSRDNAEITIQYLGAEEITARGETTYMLGGYAWTPDQFKKGARAILSMGDFSKGFHAEGINFQGPGKVIRQIEEWIRENREVILKKAGKK